MELIFSCREEEKRLDARRCSEYYVSTYAMLSHGCARGYETHLSRNVRWMTAIVLV
jgi:hypothetical protein